MHILIVLKPKLVNVLLPILFCFAVFVISQTGLEPIIIQKLALLGQHIDGWALLVATLWASSAKASTTSEFIPMFLTIELEYT